MGDQEQRIPLVDLAAQHEALKEELRQAIDSVIASSAFIHGPEVDAFEEDFATYCGVRYGVGVSSGTAALQLALLAMGVGSGDEVITVAFTFTATAEAIMSVGARPVFVDVGPSTATMDPAVIENAITPRTRAIVPVHLYGQCADMESILAIARKYRLKVIEDACQAHGAEYRGRRAGSLGDAGCFSFYPGKNLGAMGDAGIVVTGDSAVAVRVRRLADHGRCEKYLHTEVGFNHRLDSIQAAVLRVKLRHLDEWNKARRALAALYSELLAESDLGLPVEAPQRTHVYHLYVVRTRARDALQKRLADSGIATGIHYPIPLHLQPAYRYLGIPRGLFPVSEGLANEVLSLPMFPELTGDQVGFVVKTLLGLNHG